MRFSLAILFLFVVQFSFGQDSAGDHPYLDRKPGLFRLYSGLTPYDEKKATKFDRFNTDFFYNDWLGDLGQVSTKFYSIGHNINLMFDIPFSKTSRMGIAIGLGYGHFSVRHNGELSFKSEAGMAAYSTHLKPYLGAERWINRTVFNFVEVPFELRFRSLKERGKWKFYPGFKAGFMVENYSKWRIGSNEFKNFNFPDLNRLHYGPTLRIGRDNIFLFGYYDMTTLFTHPNSSQLQLISLGVSIGWF
ncbi:porin family protein [Crocinitomix catalasitica]|uniref:outer membrane beta-barrel protein n=1 Tax=Crocinitomix catalasitica TaxID=184607 RepID=UPI000488B8AD|nr:outer membrane beta-barrel protein [Crocinitomix catalasitica]